MTRWTSRARATSKKLTEGDEQKPAEEAAPAAATDGASAEAPRDRAVEEARIATEEAEDKGIAPWMAVSMAIGVVLGVALFIFVPALVTNLVVGDYSGQNMVLWNVIDGILRAGIFVLYMWLIGLMPDIKRMFCYHGAEHKTIHCLEHGWRSRPRTAEASRASTCAVARRSSS